MLTCERRPKLEFYVEYTCTIDGKIRVVILLKEYPSTEQGASGMLSRKMSCKSRSLMFHQKL